jgi:hypothetical protein
MKLLKFFTLKVYKDGKTRRCSLRERIKWVLQGCPLRNKKVVNRAVRMAQNSRAS